MRLSECLLPKRLLLREGTLPSRGDDARERCKGACLNDLECPGPGRADGLMIGRGTFSGMRLKSVPRAVRLRSSNYILGYVLQILTEPPQNVGAYAGMQDDFPIRRYESEDRRKLKARFL